MQEGLAKEDSEVGIARERASCAITRRNRFHE
jgi:hypothetical protein